MQPNDTPEGRNANRRVIVVILSTDGASAKPIDKPDEKDTPTIGTDPAAPNAAGTASPALENAAPAATAAQDATTASTQAPTGTTATAGTAQ
jgi:chemotaxis protein MotB